MILIVMLATVYSISILFDLPTKLSEHSVIAHHFCLQLLPRGVENSGSLEALVCGENMHERELQSLLMQTSLIHVFIVSGSHFIFLHKLLVRIPTVRFFTLFLLFLYCLACLCQPPAVRAFVFLALLSFARRNHLFISPVILVFISAALSVCIFPQWLGSRSLLMSLLAALTIGVMSDFWGSRRSTLFALASTQSAVYLVMSVCLWGFSALHPLSILLNISIAPLIGGIIFPLALLVVAVPPLKFLFDIAMNALIWLLQKTTEVMSEPSGGTSVSVHWQWGLYLTLTVGSYFVLVLRKRQKARHV